MIIKERKRLRKKRIRLTLLVALLICVVTISAYFLFTARYRFNFNVSDIESVAFETLTHDPMSDTGPETFRTELEREKWPELLDGLKDLKPKYYFMKCRCIPSAWIEVRLKKGKEIRIDSFFITINGKSKKYKSDVDKLNALIERMRGESGGT